jgi:hypothetical protein
MTSPNKDGWVYSDDYWNITRAPIDSVDGENENQNKEAMTRRRRWIRECEKL